MNAAELPAGSGVLSGPLTPEQALAAFEFEPGVGAQLVAAEPLVHSPAALAWDEDGQLFVAENTDYPVGPPPGQAPSGAIVQLVDTDRDGRADQRVVFADGLRFPNGILPWRQGLLVTDAPHLYWLADTNNDGHADVREIWLTGFATNQTTQLRACYPSQGPDGWIYVSRGWSGGVVRSPKWPDLPAVDLKDGDLRFRPDGSAMETLGGNAQFGMVLDDLGRRFFVSNRNPLVQAVVHPRWWQRNRWLPGADLVQDVAAPGAEAKVYPRSPDTTTAGFMPELMSQPHAGTFTSACGIHQYFGDGFGPEFQGSWFICEPAQNLIQRQIAEPTGASFVSHRATEGREFVASRDPWFHPVFAATGPDGALYCADLYRQWIDHPDYLPAGVRGQLDFNAGKERGRIWKFFAPDAAHRLAHILLSVRTESLVDVLGSQNVWVRNTAYRLLTERPPKEILPAVLAAVDAETRLSLPVAILNRWTNIVRNTTNHLATAPWGRIRRLQLLGGLMEATARDATLAPGMRQSAARQLMAATFERAPLVRETAWRIFARIAWQAPEPRAPLPNVPANMIEWWAEDPDPSSRFHFALLCGEPGEGPALVPTLALLARQDPADRWIRTAILSGLSDRELPFLEAFFARPPVRESVMALWTEDLGRLLGTHPEAPVAFFLDQLLRPTADGTTWQAAGLRGLSLGLRSRGGESLAALARRTATNRQTTLTNLVARLEQVGTRAAVLARDSQATPTRRVAALQFLGELDFAQAREPLLAALAAAEPAEVRIAAMRSLGQFNEVSLARDLLAPERWKELSAPLRDAALGAILSRPAMLPPLLDALERGDLPIWLVDPQRRRQLQERAEPAVRERANKLFSQAGGGDRRKVFEELRPILALPASGARGQAVYTRTCAPCHPHSGQGAKVGPDLTGVRNQPAEALLLHIIVPDAEIYPGYQAFDVETRDGRSLTGLVVQESAEAITLRRAGGEQEEIRRSNLKSLTMSRLSLMPQELEKTMTREELADLIAFLRGQP